MRTRSSSNLPVVSPPYPLTSNPKRRNRRRSKQPFILEESPIDTMVDQRTMADLLHAPTEGYAEAIVVPLILVEQFELKYSLINMMTSDQFFGLEKDNPHDHIRWFNKITSTIKYKDVPNSVIKLMLFPFSLAGAARRWLEKEPPRFIHTWDDLVSKFINEFFPPSRTTNLRNEISNFQQWFDESFHEAWDRYKDLLRGNLLERRTQDVLTIIENKSKFQATPPPASVKAVKGICVTCGGAHPYYQCLAVGGNTFPKLRDNIQGYVSAAAVNYNQVKRLNESNVKAMQTQINNVKNELRNEMKNSIQASMSNQTNEIKNMMASLFQMNTASTSDLSLATQLLTQRVNSKPSPLEVLHINITLADALILMPKYQKMLKALLSNKEKLQELANTPLNENCSAVILKKLPKKLGDPGKFFILCGFNELKCKALADLGSSINLTPLSVWKKLGLPELIFTRMTLELANRAICTAAGIARDVFVPVGKFTFPTDFVIVDYESDHRVPFILGRPFLRTARALIDVHGKEMILHDGDERLILNMRHNTSSYSNHPHKESINLVNVSNNSSEDFLADLFSTNQPSEGGNVLPEKLLDLDSTKDLHPPLHINPLSGSTTYSSSPNQLLEGFTDELSLITFPPEYDDDLQFDNESDLKEIEYLLHHDLIKGLDSSLKDSIDQSSLADLCCS
uniref:Retrotransposon gag domain-containing protein n=1 Tax=Tanacetum cinerariifolium TaxID=118510 RepID=A0A6L2JDK1_TANCI|nr:hypothetical protein [Tanacetum cinerariifolium]